MSLTSTRRSDDSSYLEEDYREEILVYMQFMDVSLPLAA